MNTKPPPCFEPNDAVLDVLSPELLKLALEQENDSSVLEKLLTRIESVTELLQEQIVECQMTRRDEYVGAYLERCMYIMERLDMTHAAYKARIHELRVHLS